jgi:hypothetical protein
MGRKYLMQQRDRTRKKQTDRFSDAAQKVYSIRLSKDSLLADESPSLWADATDFITLKP